MTNNNNNNNYAEAEYRGPEEYVYWQFLQVLLKVKQFDEYKTALHTVARLYTDRVGGTTLPQHFATFLAYTTTPDALQLFRGIATCQCRLCGSYCMFMTRANSIHVGEELIVVVVE